MASLPFVFVHAGLVIIAVISGCAIRDRRVVGRLEHGLNIKILSHLHRLTKGEGKFTDGKLRSFDDRLCSCAKQEIVSAIEAN